MKWFERHLNWSLFLGVSGIPGVVALVGAILLVVGFASGPLQNGIEGYLAAFAVYFIILSIFIFITSSLVTWWYLGKKGRSKWYLLLIIFPWVLGLTALLIAYSSSSTDPFGMQNMGVFIIRGLTGLASTIGFIWLLCLQNRGTDHGPDFVSEPVTDRWPDSSPTGGYDERLTRELDYTPSQNVLDIAASQPVKNIRYTSNIPVGGSQNVQEAVTESPAAEKALERPAGTQRPQMPILMDDSGAVITCFYHPGADAVNRCSRCNQYVCFECNFVTGTHPICRNCWERRAEVPIAPPPQKVSPAPRKPEEKKVMEPTPPAEQEHALPAEPVEPKVAEVTQPAIAEPTLVEPAKPAEPVVQEPVEPEPQPVAQLVTPAQPQYEAPTKPEKQKTVKPEKSAKEEAQKREWQSEFMGLYQQSAPIIHVVVSKSTDGMPASPLDLMEGLKLRPMLERVKKLSKPKDKELREAKSQLEQVLSSCIKIADAAANFVSGGGQALLGGPDFKRIVEGIETANGLMEKLSQKMATFSPPQE